MKYEINFAEMAEIMNAIVKAEKKAEEFKAIKAVEEDAYKAYAESDCSLALATEWSNAYQAREKVRKSFRKAIKEAGELLFNDDNGYERDEFNRYAKDCYESNIERLLYMVRSAAMQQMRYINL